MHFSAGPNSYSFSRVSGVTLSMACAYFVLVTSCWGQTQSPATAASSEGLKNLLPAEPPEDIINTLSTLPETWAPWSESLTTQLGEFYGKTPDTVAGQRAALTRFKKKLTTIDTALSDSRYGSIRGPLSSLRGALSRRIEVLEAVLETLASDALVNPSSALAGEKANLLSAVNQTISYLDGAVGGASWKTYLRTGEIQTGLANDTGASQLLATLQTALRNARSAAHSDVSKVRDFVAGSPLKTYQLQLDRTVAALTREKSGINIAELRSQLKTLIAGLEDFEATGIKKAAVQVRAAYDALRDLAPDGGDRLTAPLRRHYFNSNLNLVVSESFLNRMLTKSEVKPGVVRDFILGADVYGDQTTADQSSFDLLPSPNGAYFHINLTGTVTTSTEGHASKAVIYSQGNNQFFGSKPVRFNGDTFSTEPAIVSATAVNEPYDASTRADNIPLLGGFARRIALNAAYRQNPAAEAIAVERVTSRIKPEFDAQVDQKMNDLNSKLMNDFVRPLKSENLYPDYRSSSSTDTEFAFNSRLMADDELGGGTAPNRPLADGEIALRLHESLINNALSRLDLGGKTMTEGEFRDLIESRVQKLFQKPLFAKHSPQVTAEANANEPKSLIFDERDPVKVKFFDGTINLIIRAGFQRDEDQGGNIPPQIVTVPWSISIAGEEVLITPGEISVAAMDQSDNIAEQLVRSTVIKTKIARSLHGVREKRKLTFNRDDGAPVTVNVTAAEALDGWLAIHVQ